MKKWNWLLACGLLLVFVGGVSAVDPLRKYDPFGQYQGCPPYQPEPQALQVGRYQISGKYRLDTATGEVELISDVVKVEPKPAPTTVTVTVGGEEIYQGRLFAGDYTVDLTEAVMLWVQARLSMLCKPVPV